MSSRFHDFVYQKGAYHKKILHTCYGVGRRFSDILYLPNCDAVFIHREAFPFFSDFIEKMIAARRPIIYDFDDAIYLMNPAKPSLVPSLRRPSKINDIIRISTRIIAGNKFLASYAQKYNQSIKIIPTCIDTDHYRPVNNVEQRRKVVIGWIGTHSTIGYLNEIRSALANVYSKYNVELKIVADEDIDIGIPITFKKWDLNEELTDLQSMDIGIMPLPDNKWTQGKCGYKLLQYMAVGKPVIASPVGANIDIVKEGSNGYFANGTDEWENKLTLLIMDKTKRINFGTRGRSLVEESYSLKVNAPRLLSVIKSV